MPSGGQRSPKNTGYFDNSAFLLKPVPNAGAVSFEAEKKARPGEGAAIERDYSKAIASHSQAGQYPSRAEMLEPSPDRAKPAPPSSGRQKQGPKGLGAPEARQGDPGSEQPDAAGPNPKMAYGGAGSGFEDRSGKHEKQSSYQAGYSAEPNGEGYSPKRAHGGAGSGFKGQSGKYEKQSSYQAGYSAEPNGEGYSPKRAHGGAGSGFEGQGSRFDKAAPVHVEEQPSGKGHGGIGQSSEFKKTASVQIEERPLLGRGRASLTEMPSALQAAILAPFVKEAAKESKEAAGSGTGIGESFYRMSIRYASAAVTGAHKSAKLAKGAATLSVKAAKAVWGAASAIIRAFVAIATGAPVVVSLPAIAAVIALAPVLAFIAALLSFKGAVPELTQAYRYITLLDAYMERDINAAALKSQKNSEGFEFTLNGAHIAPGEARVWTDADKALLYFDTRYGSYSFEAVKEEIEYMHSQLHSFSVETDKVTGGVRVAVESKPVQAYIDSAGALSKSQKEQMALMDPQKQYLSLIEAKSPVGKSFEASQRWGFRNGSGGLEMHSGIDIPAESGDAAVCALDGEVSMVQESPSGGIKAVVSNGVREASYCGLESLYVNIGQQVKAGDPIGLIGSFESGAYSLHFEYSCKGEETNPAFFIDGCMGVQEPSGAPFLGSGLSGVWVMPASGVVSSFTANRETSHANYRAIDIAMPVGTPVYASQQGTVTMAEYNGTYGNCVQIRHADGYSTLYAHLSSFKCSVGDTVVQGKPVALSGNTGNSTGPHLHFEIRKNGIRLDLRRFFWVNEGDRVTAGTDMAGYK